MFNVNDLVKVDDGKFAVITGIVSQLMDDVYTYKGNNFEGYCDVASAHRYWKLAKLSAQKSAEVRQLCTGLRDV